MVAVELVVAVARERERARGLDPAGEQLQHVERCLVRPMHVLEHEDSGTARELANQPGRQFMGPRAALYERLKLAGGDLRDVEEGSERTGREQGVTGTPEDPRRVVIRIAEPAQQHALSDARLAANQHQAAVRAIQDGRKRRFERRQVTRSFKQLGGRPGPARCGFGHDVSVPFCPTTGRGASTRPDAGQAAVWLGGVCPGVRRRTSSRARVRSVRSSKWTTSPRGSGVTMSSTGTVLPLAWTSCYRSRRSRSSANRARACSSSCSTRSDATSPDATRRRPVLHDTASSRWTIVTSAVPSSCSRG